MEENQDTGLETEPQKNYRGKSPRNRLLDRVKQLDSLSRNKELKLAKLADVQLEIASLERLLYNDSREDRNSETLTELATATEQLTRANAEIARLTQANAELRASQQPVRVEIQQDPTISTLRADNAAKGELLAAISSAVSSLPHVERVNFGAVLVKQLGRASGVQAFVSQITDFSILWLYSQKSDDELQEIIAAAFKDSQGSAVVAAKATLGARRVQIAPPAKAAPCHDFFA